MIDIEMKSPEEKREYFDLLYQKVIGEGFTQFNSEKDYQEACHLLIRLCLSVNDYIHANNVMQCYKSAVKSQRASWFHYYGIVIHGKRYPNYFLHQPDALIKKVERYLKTEEPTKLEDLLNNIIHFYNKLFINYQDVFKDNLKLFTKYFLKHPLILFPMFNAGVKQLNDLLEGTIDYEDIDFDQKDVKKVKVNLKETPAIIYSKNPKVLIIGALSIGKDKVYGIAKKIGFTKDQIEIIHDFNVIKAYEIQKLRYNQNYCGIITGPVPHSSKSSANESSLITQIENNDGYPYHLRAMAGEQLKLTKKSIEESLKEIHDNYLITSV